MGEQYDFNPFLGADHSKKTYLGQPGTGTIIIATLHQDPKYQGPCGHAYHRYIDCLRLTEFNRAQCRPS